MTGQPSTPEQQQQQPQPQRTMVQQQTRMIQQQRQQRGQQQQQQQQQQNASKKHLHQRQQQEQEPKKDLPLVVVDVPAKKAARIAASHLDPPRHPSRRKHPQQQHPQQQQVVDVVPLAAKTPAPFSTEPTAPKVARTKISPEPPNKNPFIINNNNKHKSNPRSFEPVVDPPTVDISKEEDTTEGCTTEGDTTTEGLRETFHDEDDLYSSSSSGSDSSSSSGSSNSNSSCSSGEDPIAKDEFEAYRQAYLKRKRRQELQRKLRLKRRSKSSSSSSSWSSSNNCSKICMFCMFGLVIQLLATAIVLVVFFSLEGHPELNNYDPSLKNPGEDNNNGTSTTTTTTTTSGSSTGGGSVVFLAFPPDSIHYWCHPDHVMAPAGRQECQDVCEKANCCNLSVTPLEDDMSLSCLENSPQACQAYQQACSVLLPFLQQPHISQPQDMTDDDDGEQPTIFPNAIVLWEDPSLLAPAPALLSATCQAAYILGDGFTSEETSGAALTCHETCHAASCCWDTTLTRSVDRCWTHPNCLEYSDACRVLMLDKYEATTAAADDAADDADDADSANKEEGQELDNGSNTAVTTNAIPPAPATMTDVCHPFKIESNLDDLLACQQACLPAECCWNTALFPNRCSLVHPEESSTNRCEEYAYTCSVLTVPTMGFEKDSSGENTDTNPVVADAPEEESTSTTTTTATAITTAASNISGNNNTSSSEYYSKETIHDVCMNHNNDINIQNGLPTLCEQVCEAGLCCFNSQEACSINDTTLVSQEQGGGEVTEKELFCAKYLPCLVLYSSSDMVSSTKTVQEACADMDDLTDCVELCSASTCCFTTDPWKSCAATDTDIVCADYTDCEVLYQGPSSSASTTTTTTTNSKSPTATSTMSSGNENDGTDDRRRYLRSVYL